MKTSHGIKPYHIIQFSLLLFVPLAFFPPWVSLPFSGSVSGLGYTAGAVTAVKSLLPFGVLFLASIPTLAFCIYFKKTLPAVVLSSLCLAFVLLMLVFMVSADTRTLPYYVQDVEDFKSLRNFFGSYFIPNKGGGIRLPLENPLDSVSGRLVLVTDVLSWGWYLTASVCSLLVLFAIKRAGLVSALLAIPVVLAPSALYLYPALQASEFRRDAQLEFANGNYPAAFKHLLTAFKLDPLLSYSSSSTTLFSQLNAVTYGENLPSAVLYKTENLESKGQRLKTIQMLEQALKDRGADENFVFTEYQVKRRLLSYSIEMATKFFRVEKWNEALTLLRRTQFSYPDNAVTDTFVTLPYMRQNAPESCVAAANDALRKILKSSVVADILSTRGECQLMMGASDVARDSFSQALDIDNERNLRAVRGLSGT